MVEEWRARLAAREISAPEWGEGWRPAAVFLLLMHGAHGYDVLLTRRTESVRHHRGQISFPGGAIEPEDESALQAGLREVHEEVGIPGHAISLIGELDEVTAISGFRVKPFVGLVRPDTTLTPNPDEIAEILMVPLGHLQDPLNCRHEDWMGRIVYHFDWQGHDIWGLTGRILHHFLSIIAGREPSPDAES